MSALAKTDYKANALQVWNEANPSLAARGIDEPTWNSLCTTIYPGAKPDSIIMAIDYCMARKLDVMLKPVHLVPMNVKNAQTGNYEWRDVPMPGIGMYRIQSARSGNVAGIDEPIYGEMITQSFTDKNGKPVSVTFPEWCMVRVHKLIDGRMVSYSAKEYWIENYASEGKTSDAPNTMWRKRPRGQIAKCAEAQALRKGWPEIDQGVTAEEMEGNHGERDITPPSVQPAAITLISPKSSLKSRTAKAAPIEAEVVVQQQEPVNGPDFGDDDEPEQFSPEVQSLLNMLIDCYEDSHFKEWKARTAGFAKNSPEFISLVGAYNARRAELKTQAQGE